MRKMILFALCVTVLLSGCSSESAATLEQNSDVASAAESVYGKIKTINGNELLLVIGSYSESDSREGSSGENASAGARGGDQQRPERMPQTGENSSRSEGERSRRTQSGGAQSSADTGAEQGETAQGITRSRVQQQGGGSGGAGGKTSGFVLGDKELTYLIPVTAIITTGQGDNSREIRFTQLAVKNIVRLNLDENNNIISVEVVA